MRCGFILVLVMSSAAGHAAAQDPAADDFERASLGGDWARYGGSPAAIVDGSNLGTPNAANWCFVGWTRSTFDRDQFSEVVLADSLPSYMLVQVYARRRSSDIARYGFHYNSDPGEAQWEIKYDGVPTPQTRILASVPAVAGPLPGDRLRIEVRGTDPVEIRGFHNGTMVIMATDAAPQRIAGTGPAGMVSRRAQGDSSTGPAAIFASWSGGSLALVMPDAGPPVVDAGPPDAGPPSSDAGPPAMDAGEPIDAGPTRDGGAPAGDAGPDVMADTGVGVGGDAGVVDDAGLDASSSEGLDAGPDRIPAPSGGCSCAVRATAPVPLRWAFGGLLLAFATQRRRRVRARLGSASAEPFRGRR